MTENNLHRPGTTIVIKVQGGNGAEEVEEIELDEEATHFLAQFVDRNGIASDNEQEVTGDIIGVQEIEQGAQQQSSCLPYNNGNTYILNSDTGELELLQMGESVPPVGRGEEVEVVTIDSNLLPGGGVIQIQREEQNQPLLQYNAFLDQLTRNVGKSQVTRGGVPQPRTVKQTPSITRMKSAPALLRSSRRATSAAGAPGSCDKNSSTSERISGEQKKPSVNVRRPSGNSSRQGQTSVPSKGISTTRNPEETEGLQLPATAQELYFIYQNADGEQVAQIIDNSSRSSFLSSPTMNVLCQYENSSILFRSSDIGTLPVSTISTSKDIKSRNKKTVRKPRPSASKNGRKRSANGKKGGVAELKCMEKGCSNVAFNIVELRKHLTNEHDMLFDSEKVVFPSDAAFKEWREQYERERMVSFIYRGGTKKISKEQSVTYMICHRSGHYKPTMTDESKRQRKMKPQGSCKIGGYCTASIKLLKNLLTGEVNMDICHTHYGHPLDSEAIPHLRVNPVLRKIILKKFEEGLTFPQMLAYIHHNPDRLEGLRMVDRRAVRNIHDTWKGLRQKKVDDEGTMEDILNEEAPHSDNIPEQTEIQDLCHKIGSEVERKLFLDDSAAESEGDEEMTGELPIENINHYEEETTTMLLNDSAENWEKARKCKIDIGECSDSQNTDSTPKSKDNYSDDDAPILHAVDEEVSKSNGEYLNDGEESIPVLVAVDPARSLKRETTKRKKCKKGRVGVKRKKLLEKVGKVKTESVTEDEMDRQDMCGSLLSTEDHDSNHSFSQEDDFDMPNIQISPELEATICKLHNHGESGPTILLYKPVGEINVKYGDFCRAFREDDFCLIIQTPVQRQILQMFPKIIHYEILDKPKPSERDLKLSYLSVLDDYREAIPVAWIVADSMCPRILNQLCRTMRYHCGELAVQYIMAPKNSEILKSWTTHFRHKPKILQNEFSAKRDLRILLNRNIPNDRVRNNASIILDEMMNGKSPGCLKKLKEKLAKLIKPYPNGSAYLRKLEKDWFSRIEEWSLAYRTSGTSCNLLFASDSFLKLKKFVSFKGTKQINQTVDHILKIGYDKCFLRTKRMFKGDQKFCRLLEKLDKYHILARNELKDAVIANDPTDEGKWTIMTEEGEEGNEDKVEVSQLKSLCDCKIICKRCNICMHAYVCSCKDFSEEHTMCAHIHRIHCYRTGKPMEDHDETPTVAEVEGNNQAQCPQREIFNVDADAVGEEVQEAVICEDGTEITFVSDNQIEGLNLTEVLQAASGLFGQHDGGELPKIVSITDADDDKIIFDGEAGVPLIFQYDGDVEVE